MPYGLLCVPLTPIPRPLEDKAGETRSSIAVCELVRELLCVSQVIRGLRHGNEQL